MMDPRFKIVYPGVYDEVEQKVLQEIQTYMAEDQEKAMDLIRRQMNGETFYPGLELNSAFRPTEFTIGSQELSSTAGKINPYNPLYNDIDYAKKTKYGRILSAPMAVDVSAGFPYMPKETDAWVWVSDDYVPNVKGGLDHEMTFYQPVGAGDTVRTVVTRQAFEDITDPAGSEFRTLRLIGEGDLYNQNDEKVAHMRHTCCERYHVFSDPKYAADFKGTTPHHSTVRRYRDWSKARPWHIYTDEEWETIKQIWENEYIRGADTLYWEDVNIGDEPTPTADGPFPNDQKMPQMDLRISVRDALTKDPSELFKGPPGMPPMPGMGGKVALGKDEHGIITVKAEMTGPGGPGGPAGPVTKDPNERASFQNTDGRDYCVRLVTNWMGDEGWLYQFGWRLTSDIDHNKFPEDFDRPSYLLKVPYLKEQGKYMTTHGFAGDVSINRAYVCDKYIRDGKHYVDLVVWGETIDGEIYTECYAVVELPSRESI